MTHRPLRFHPTNRKSIFSRLKILGMCISLLLPLNFLLSNSEAEDLLQLQASQSDASGSYTGTASTGETLNFTLTEINGALTGSGSFVFAPENFQGTYNLSGSITNGSFVLSIQGTSVNCGSLNATVTGTIINNLFSGTLTGTDCDGLSNTSTISETNNTPHTLETTVAPAGSPNPVSSEGLVNVTVSASDTSGHTPTFSWSATCLNLDSNGTFTNSTLQNPGWTAPRNESGGPQTCTLTVVVNDGVNLTVTDSYSQQVDHVVFSSGGVFDGPKSSKVVSPYWQTDSNSYSFLAVSHASLSGINSEVGVRINAVVDDGSELYGPPAEFTVRAGATQQVFIAAFDNPQVNAQTLPSAQFIVGTSTLRKGSLVINPVATHPAALAGPSGAPGRGYPDITQLNFWGAVVVQNTATGFAMQFVGDQHDSRAFNTPNVSGVN